MILAMIHQKGGTGKSTISIALALWLVKRGRIPILLDVDSQGTSSAWGRRYGKRFGVDVIPSHARLVKSDVLEKVLEYDDVIIDLPPTVMPQTEAAIEVADMLLIPMRPTQPDLWALDRLIALIMLSARKPLPPYRVLFSQADAENLEAIMDALSKRRITVLETIVPAMADFQNLFEGQGLSDQADIIISNIIQELPPSLIPQDN
jgi:chromosome partitioning protein